MKRLFALFCALMVIGCVCVPVVCFADGDVSDVSEVSEEPWAPDNSSIFTSIRSTVSHYLFNDDYTDVPFGSGWVDLICTVLTCAIFLLPFFILIIAFRWICRF